MICPSTLRIGLLGVASLILVPIRRAAKKLGIAPQQMMVKISHTHAAPNVTPCRSFMQSYEEEYLEATRDKLCNLLASARSG